MPKKILIIIAFTVIILLFGFNIYLFAKSGVGKSGQIIPSFLKKSQSKACTQEAKLCPDGSYVSRSGPNCEFTACPASVINKCSQNSDCQLTYTGNASCAPCDHSVSDYKCLSLDEAKKIQDERRKKQGIILCEMCLPQDRNFNYECICKAGICEKTEKIDTSNWESYRNEEYGFEIKFPKTWNDYIITEEKNRTRENYDFQKYKEVTSLNFEHPKKISSEGRPGEVGFSIIIFDEKNWKLAQGIGEIGRNNLYIFGFYPSNAAAPNDLLDRYNEINQILSTFKFTK